MQINPFKVEVQAATRGAAAATTPNPSAAHDDQVDLGGHPAGDKSQCPYLAMLAAGGDAGSEKALETGTLTSLSVASASGGVGGPLGASFGACPKMSGG